MSDRPRLNPAFQSIFLIIASDVLAGYWLGIHREQAVEFFLSQVPLIGAAGVLWSFFPKQAKENLGAWLEWTLGARLTRVGLVLGLAGLLATTFFRVSTSVTLAGDTTTWLYLARDRDGTPDPAAMLDSARLNSLSSPVAHSRWRRPSGLAAWWYSPTMITKAALTMRFWRPASVVYPDDFDSLAMVTALPGAWLFNRLATDTARVLIQATGHPLDTVATFAVNAMASFLVSFLPPASTPPDTLRWRQAVAGTADSARSVVAWSRTTWVKARRPIRPGDGLTWRLTIGIDTLTYNPAINHATSQIYLAR